MSGGNRNAWSRSTGRYERATPTIITTREDQLPRPADSATGSSDVEIRKIVCTTNAIESVNSRIRRAVKARGHFPNEQAALKCVYMAIMSLDPTGTGQRRWSMRWKPALNAFDMAFDGRLSAGRK